MNQGKLCKQLKTFMILVMLGEYFNLNKKEL